jgi:hypothetical protein
LRIADRGLRIADCGLRIADCGLRIADCGLRIVAVVASVLHDWRVEERMLLTLVFVLLLLWLLGLVTSYTLGGVLHVLLVIAIVLFLVHIIQGRSIGNA